MQDVALLLPVAPLSDSDALTAVAKHARFELDVAGSRLENPGVYEGRLEGVLEIVSYPLYFWRVSVR